MRSTYQHARREGEDGGGGREGGRVEISHKEGSFMMDVSTFFDTRND